MMFLRPRSKSSNENLTEKFLREVHRAKLQFDKFELRVSQIMLVHFSSLHGWVGIVCIRGIILSHKVQQRSFHVSLGTYF
jgi:uncharacterized membrane protein YsdA (DUF1294 family)